MFLTGQEEIDELTQILTKKFKELQTSKIFKRLKSHNHKSSDKILKMHGDDQTLSDELFLVLPLYANLP